MSISILQLNILKGQYLPTIIDYIQKNNFDVVTMQEVTGGGFGKISEDIFEVLKSSLAFKGNITLDIVDPTNSKNYYGTAALYSPRIDCLQENILRTTPITHIYPSEQSQWRKIKRSAIALTLKKGGVEFDVITTHGAWSNRPDDNPDKIDQAKTISAYLTSLTTPFVFTGDLNVTSDT